MMTHVHTPSPACATFAPLLPLAAHGMLSGPRAAALDEHLAGCRHCSEELATHAAVDTALRQAFAAPPSARLPFSRAEIVGLLTRASERTGLPAQRGIEDGGPKRRRWLAGVPAVAAVVLLAVLAQALFAWLHSSSGGRLATPQPLPANIELKSLSMISPTEGWAVGNSTPHPDPHYAGFLDTEPVILHYLNGAWSVVPNPARVRGYTVSVILTSVSVDSSTDGWAVGHSVFLTTTPGVVADGMTTGVLLHYTGGQWTVAEDNLAYAPTSVFMRAADDGWMVSDVNGIMLHYDGRAWTPMRAPSSSALIPAAVTGVKGGDVWVAATDFGGSAGSGGSDTDAPEVVLRYDGRTWTRESFPDPHERITSLAMTSPTSGWAVGVLPRPTTGSGSGDATKPDNALILRYRDGTWKEQARFPGPVDTFTSLNGIAMVSASDGWAVGTDGLIVGYSHGVWARLASPTSQTLQSIAMVSAAEGWAVGDHGTILHYAGGVWSLYRG